MFDSQGEFLITGVFQGKRISEFLLGKFKNINRFSLQNAFHKQFIRVNNHPVDLSYLLIEGDIIQWDLTSLRKPEIFPEEIPLDIVFECNDFLVLNKPSGMACHPGLGIYKGTLLHALKYYYQKTNQAEVLQNGLIHRLDKKTSGLILVAKTKEALLFYTDELKNARIERIYLAGTQQKPQLSEDWIDLPVGRDKINPHEIKVLPIEEGGKSAQTFYRTIESGKNVTWLLCKLVQGRTHQIRIHLKSIGCPIIGDDRYGTASLDEPLMLSAIYLSFRDMNNLAKTWAFELIQLFDLEEIDLKSALQEFLHIQVEKNNE